MSENYGGVSKFSLQSSALIVETEHVKAEEGKKEMVAVTNLEVLDPKILQDVWCGVIDKNIKFY